MNCTPKSGHASVCFFCGQKSYLPAVKDIASGEIVF